MDWGSMIRPMTRKSLAAKAWLWVDRSAPEWATSCAARHREATGSSGTITLTLAWWRPSVMRTRLRHARRPDVSAIVLLAALIFRAYIPVGFMPASGTPFLVELCPAYAGDAAAHHVHHHHSQGQTDFQNCPFGSTPAPGPISHLIGFESAGRITSFVEIPPEPARPAIRLLRTHQPRGPPSLV